MYPVMLDLRGRSVLVVGAGPVATRKVEGLIAEGAMYDWSVLYVTQELHSEPGFAALAYASFSAAMAAARFGGDWVRERVSPPLLMSSSAALAAVSMAAVLWIAHPVAALVGFALVGLGFANVCRCSSVPRPSLIPTRRTASPWWRRSATWE